MSIFEEKRSNSIEKLSKLRSSMADCPEVHGFSDLAIFVTGSYAREEASQFSDIDLFFVHRSELTTLDEPNINSLRLFSKIIAISDEMGFPRFSNDGQFLKILEHPRILENLGGPNDDHLNHFTARMLMILESKWVYGEANYKDILSLSLGAYFKDYPDHPENFKPTFLVNDIIRFWKTLCLNYENKRNQPEGNEVKIINQKIRNLKLKFSRMLTCFGSICFIASLGNPGLQEVFRMTEMTPLERLRKAASESTDARHIAIVEEQYRWFLSLTNVSEEDLKDSFRDKELRRVAFEKADQFGASVFQLTCDIAARNGYLRYLVV